MTELLSERRLALTDLAKREGVDVTTVWRWKNRGARGVCLETFLVGGNRFTTEEAFERFVERTTAAGQDEVPHV